MQQISIQVRADDHQYLDLIRSNFPDAVIVPVDRMTGKQLFVTVLLPVTLAAAQIVAPYIVQTQPAGRKRVVISSEVIDAENLSKDELEAALVAYVKVHEQSAQVKVPAKGTRAK